MSVLYRTDAPGQRREAATNPAGRIGVAWEDGFTFVQEGRPVHWVQTGRLHGMRPREHVAVSGVTDGVVLNASAVRRTAVAG